jgi:hypothetical protein
VAFKTLVLTFEELHRALVLLGCGPAGECAEVSPPAGSRIDLSGVQAVLTGL